ncbi:hypothetical protein [Virgibacillus sp. Bac330]|uniref:hypothetical protein n=1 Tax=Virgibacillus sp. Bac330 TaxID=2419841 RepID=UPI000EF47E1C|nr:hypothetical protein [Virgibacillus sp. Bac330]
MLKLLNNLYEEDFSVLRGPLKSGRQSPNSMAGMLIFSIFLQIFMFVLIYIVAADRSIFPFKEILKIVHLVLTIILIILSIVYSINSVYRKHEELQYLVSILVSQNLFGVFPFLGALFFLGKELSKSLLLFLTIITLILGVLIVMITAIRFYFLLKKGEYRGGSKKGQLRSKFETTTYLPAVIIGSTGLVFVIQHIIRNMIFVDLELIILVVVGFGVFFTMLFVLPEQLVILYCKYRFESFNFDKDGNLKPMGSEREDD